MSLGSPPPVNFTMSGKTAVDSGCAAGSIHDCVGTCTCTCTCTAPVVTLAMYVELQSHGGMLIWGKSAFLQGS